MIQSITQSVAAAVLVCLQHTTIHIDVEDDDEVDLAIDDIASDVVENAHYWIETHRATTGLVFVFCCCFDFDVVVARPYGEHGQCIFFFYKLLSVMIVDSYREAAR